jgi:hypothetical protein
MAELTLQVPAPMRLRGTTSYRTPSACVLGVSGQVGHVVGVVNPFEAEELAELRDPIAGRSYPLGDRPLRLNSGALGNNAGLLLSQG